MQLAYRDFQINGRQGHNEYNNSDWHSVLKEEKPELHSAQFQLKSKFTKSWSSVLDLGLWIPNDWNCQEPSDNILILLQRFVLWIYPAGLYLFRIHSFVV